MGQQPSAGNHHHHATCSWPKLPDGSVLEEASATFRALGDPTRLRLLVTLADSEVCVTELADLEEEKTDYGFGLASGLYTKRGLSNGDERQSMSSMRFRTPTSAILLVSPEGLC
jgi:DNA-binding transcriptional ArsR family regulator